MIHFVRLGIKNETLSLSLHSNIDTAKFESEDNCANLDVTVSENTLKSNGESFKSRVEPEIYKSIFTNHALGKLIEIDIEYPQIGYREYDEVDDAINRQLYKAVVTEEITNWKGRRYTAKIKYEVTFCNNDMLSVLFSGYLSPVSGAYNVVAHSVTFDFNTGEPLSLYDFYSLDEIETLIADFIESENCTIDPEQYKGNSASISYLKEQFLEKFGSESKSLHQNDFYIRKNKLGLIMIESSPKRGYCILEFNLPFTPSLKS